MKKISNFIFLSEHPSVVREKKEDTYGFSLRSFIPFFVIILSVCVFFSPFLLYGKLPVPADTITGLYHPFRDLYSSTNPNGLPYKNFLITDPVRQQYPWKYLSISLEKQLHVPLWNPYEMAGTPLLANFQSSPFYPLNLILFISSFYLSWSVFILLQPILAGLFLYLYLKNLRIDSRAAVLGSVTWSFSGFSIAWLEWGTILHTALWLPLILLAIDKLVLSGKQNVLRVNSKILWAGIYVFALTSSFLAGHLQTFFYLFVFSNFYFILKICLSKHKSRIIISYAMLTALYIILSLPQLLPTLQFIMLSNRSLDQSWTQSGWFIPYQNLIQFIAPDFFGNPATLNYWGIWNYAEFIGYIGMGPLILALYAALFRHDKKTRFFLGIIFFGLLMATQNFISQSPYILKIPFLSTAQPTRLMFMIDFSLAILAGLGFDHFLKLKRYIWVPLLIIGIFLAGLWVSLIAGGQLFQNPNDILIAKNNLKLPTLLYALFAVIFLSYEYVKSKRVRLILFLLIFILVLFDLFRFGWKFTPFVDKQYLYPDTKITNFLRDQPGVFRIAVTDSRILPPNFSTMYSLQSIEGYDPLYLKNYAMLIAANERSDHSIVSPYGFNRIITPRNLDSQIIDFLNVKYVLSLSDVVSPNFKKIMQDGSTRIYENLNVLPRAYFVEKVIHESKESEEAKLLFNVDLSRVAINIRKDKGFSTYSVGNVNIITYTPNKVVIVTENKGDGYLIMSDTYYKPLIHATIDGKDATNGILLTNLAFRGLFIPAGKHTVIFEAKLF